jgi:hypothetical protein
MAVKAVTTEEGIGRVGQRRQVVILREILERLNIRKGDSQALQEQANGVLTKPTQVVEPDDIPAPEKSVVIPKARPDMRAGECVTLGQLECDLAHKQPRRRRKTACLKRSR